MEKESKPFEFMGIRFESLPFNLPDGVLGMCINQDAIFSVNGQLFLDTSKATIP